MPQRSRSRRAAARQTQLGQRKKRQNRGPHGIPETIEAPQAPGDVETDDGPPSVTGSRQQTPNPHPAAIAQRISFSRQTESRPRVYTYISSEMKRIAALAAGVLVILIVLTFVLR